MFVVSGFSPLEYTETGVVLFILTVNALYHTGTRDSACSRGSRTLDVVSWATARSPLFVTNERMKIKSAEHLQQKERKKKSLIFGECFNLNTCVVTAHAMRTPSEFRSCVKVEVAVLGFPS